MVGIGTDKVACIRASMDRARVAIRPGKRRSRQLATTDSGFLRPAKVAFTGAEDNSRRELQIGGIRGRRVGVY
jgi:hypothetical protein